MTTQDQIQLIREKCIEANPEIATKRLVGDKYEVTEEFVSCRPIRLADILLAINKNPEDYSIGTDGRFMKMTWFPNGGFNMEWVKESNGVLAIGWNLLKDDLSLQSPETIQFLYQLLSTKE